MGVWERRGGADGQVYSDPRCHAVSSIPNNAYYVSHVMANLFRSRKGWTHNLKWSAASYGVTCMRSGWVLCFQCVDLEASTHGQPFCIFKIWFSKASQTKIALLCIFWFANEMTLPVYNFLDEAEHVGLCMACRKLWILLIDTHMECALLKGSCRPSHNHWWEYWMTLVEILWWEWKQGAILQFSQVIPWITELAFVEVSDVADVCSYPSMHRCKLEVGDLILAQDGVIYVTGHAGVQLGTSGVHTTIDALPGSSR